MIEAKGYEESRKKINIFNSGIIVEIQSVLELIANNVINDARFILAKNQNIDTGGLLGSIRIFDSGSDYIIVGTDAPHAGYIEFGRGPVRPVRAKVLRYFDKKTGKLVFTKYVGPTEPMPFLQPAVEKWARLFDGIMAERVEKLLK